MADCKRILPTACGNCPSRFNMRCVFHRSLLGWKNLTYWCTRRLCFWEEEAALLIRDGEAGNVHDVEHFFPEAA
ncbi:MAG: hypothetical protein IJ993_04145, partial [Akkermansia sp.]|nr:hypothetical protein [Akkermansia sp.]